MPDENKTAAPKSEGQATVGFEDPATLARLDATDKRLDDIEKNTGHTRKSLGIVLSCQPSSCK